METAVNSEIWQKVCKVPPEAQKEIGAGRLKGFTDINPAWRLQVMTQTFGPCGIGWKYTIDKLWTETGAAKNTEPPKNAPEVMAFALVSVFTYNHERDRWNDPIPGIGGSSMTALESSGPYNSDECYKMAVTDALSVALKALGVGANIYLGSKFQSKFDREEKEKEKNNQEPDPAITKLLKEAKTFDDLAKVWKAIPAKEMVRYTAIKDTRKLELTPKEAENA